MIHPRRTIPAADLIAARHVARAVAVAVGYLFLAVFLAASFYLVAGCAGDAMR